MTTTRLLARRTIRAPHRALVSTLVVIIAVTAAGAARAEDGRDLYQAACAACHASDGRGHPVDRVGFEVPLPDFTDCAFSTAEADADWLAVAHAGGPVRAFDRRMPAFGEALSEAELRGILRHIRSFCTDAAWPRGELNLPRALITEKAFPENEAVITTSVDSGDPGAVGYELLYERRLGSRTQLELMVPLDLQQGPSGDWEGGLGDVAVAVKRVLFHSLPRGAIFSAAMEL
ncbi:MAG TPA: cytochrome c, partial [Vicinamibacterales bacterium]|nr:cytochrome c [Vicinamibacterales bacterium]